MSLLAIENNSLTLEQITAIIDGKRVLGSPGEIQEVMNAIKTYDILLYPFIHPFTDGNGRMGRLWQTVILKNWREVFAWIPVEVLIKENQSLYYKALSVSDANANSTYFIEFLLHLLLETIEETLETEKKVTAKVTANQKKIIDCLKANPYITMNELSAEVGISRKSIAANIKKLKEIGYISRIGADKNGYWQVKEM